VLLLQVIDVKTAWILDTQTHKSIILYLFTVHRSEAAIELRYNVCYIVTDRTMRSSWRSASCYLAKDHSLNTSCRPSSRRLSG